MKILILCTGNSCRSQVAEGILRNLLNETDIICSAGLNPQGVNPKAIVVMQEIAIDISRQTSNHIKEYINHSFDYVITVCDNAAKNCPTFSGQGIKVHLPFDDPADALGTDEEILNEFRRIRDEMNETLSDWLKAIL